MGISSCIRRFNAECTVVVNNDAQIESVTISNEGFGYTYGNVDLAAGSVPTPTSPPTLDVIIPPPGGHGADIYRELGATNALLYARIENDAENPDFVTCLLYTSPSPRDGLLSRMPSSA